MQVGYRASKPAAGRRSRPTASPSREGPADDLVYLGLEASDESAHARALAADVPIPMGLGRHDNAPEHLNA